MWTNRPALALRSGTQTGVRTLERAEADARQLDPDVEIVGILHQGSRADQLARASQGAALLVVGRDDRTLTERLTRGNTAIGACTRSPVPTVVVPADWQPTDRRTVLVGLRSPEHVAELLDDALGLAGDLGSKAILLHAWGFPREYDVVAERYGEGAWRDQITRQLQVATAEARERHPSVPVEISVVHGPPASTLVAASAEADLLVIVRRKHGVPGFTRLGGTARAVLRAAHCAVRVVPPL